MRLQPRKPVLYASHLAGGHVPRTSAALKKLSDKASWKGMAYSGVAQR